MAKRKKHYNGVVSTSLSAVSLEDSVKLSDVLIGGAIGLIAGPGVEKLAKKYLPASLMTDASGNQSFIGSNISLLSSTVAAFGAYYAAEKFMPGSEGGIGVGCLLSGLAPVASSKVLSIMPFLNGTESVRLNGVQQVRINGMNGFIVKDPQTGLDGFIVKDQNMLNGADEVPGSSDYDDDGMAGLAEAAMNGGDDGINGLL